jgi:hypothetical protein
VPSTEVEHIFFAERPRVHALVLLRRRLQTLFGCSFQLEVRSEIGEGTTVTMRIPLLNAAESQLCFHFKRIVGVTPGQFRASKIT